MQLLLPVQLIQKVLLANISSKVMMQFIDEHHEPRWSELQYYNWVGTVYPNVMLKCGISRSLSHVSIC